MADVDPKLVLTPSPLATDANLRSRVAEAVIAQAGIRHDKLNAFLRERLASRDISQGALFSEPAIEGAAGYVSSGKTPADLSGSLLHPRVVAALAGQPGDDYRFDYPAYLHQLEAWNHLTTEEPRSVLVSSGTGSGKTECFLVPLLNDLAHEVDLNGRLTGVRALMLYPLNALIASQEERLRRWTAPLGGDIRFALYNGLMQDKRKHDRDRNEGERPEQVLYRQTLRSDPPPILVTNNTMLEYMTIRKEDYPIVEASQGMLRWIVIDEAHSYVGSAAAEVSLLLRRVLQAFGVKAEDVRFVATSATIGGSDAKAQSDLQRYLADLAGVPTANVHVVMGARESVSLPPLGSNGPLSASMESRAFSAHPSVQKFVRAAEQSPVPMSEVASLAQGTTLEPAAFLEAIGAPRRRADGLGFAPLLPLRIHKFIRAVSGMWSCVNPECDGDRPQDWPHGAILFEQADSCIHCLSHVFEVVSCRECGEPWLNAFQHGDALLPVASAPDRDEFAAASAREMDAEDEVAEGDEATETTPVMSAGGRRLIGVRNLPGLAEVGIVPATGELPERRGEGAPIWLSGAVDDGACPRCHAAPTATSRGPLWPFRFGAPFLVQNSMPTMLEGVSPSERSNIELPAGGRQLLSFTDSRQGTARFAANIETMAERGYVRSFVYHLVQRACAPSTLTAERRSELERKRAKFAELAKDDAIFAPNLAAVEKELEGGGNEASVPWGDAALALAREPMVKQWIGQVWDADRDGAFHRNPEALANFLLLRELARRPRRANAVETLGFGKLVIPALEKLTRASVPDALIQRGKTLEDWKDYLSFLVDTVIRTKFVLNISWNEARWILPRKAFLRSIVGPGQEKRLPSDIVWPLAKPSAATKSNAVLLLEHALRLDSSNAEDRASINDVLQRAWDQLRPVLEGSGSALALSFDKISIAPVEKAWLCPITNRVLPRLALGRSPYGLRGNPPGATEVPTELAFPQLPVTFPRSAQERATLVEFVANDPCVASLRQQGVWGALHDRAATSAPYIRAEEHSAQQPPHRLRAFEDQFKKGEINLLACSTTMEMGVDIGSIEAVLNTNVPPSIANYRQRVGRAGRRGQSFASSLTYARDTPLDREAFREPVAYLCRALRSPQVKLDSVRIVQRHCNALLLAEWLREASGQLTRIKAGDFFGYPQALNIEPDPAPPVAKFCDWLLEPSTAVKMARNLEVLVQRTALSGSTALLSTAASMFAEASAAFGDQWKALREQGREVSPDAKTGIEMQVKRICREPLLKELTSHSILPGHGFPTSVVPFINDCAETRDRQRGANGDEGETSRNRRYDYPTRNADVAIREYAPGAEIVIDGLVWTSAGVTLNWERPAHDAEAKEIQSLRWSWQCRDCGEAGCAHSRAAQCTACGSIAVDCSQFLAPAGFRVDWKSKPHADTDQVAYIEPQPARISARRARWEPLLDPALGRVRATGDGMVFHHSSGVQKEGYRICLDCGRAAEEGVATLADHDALMPRRGASGRCPGNDKTYAITQPLALGYEVLTDVAELQPAGLVSLGAAWALASAVREALSRQLGIEPRELGLAVERRSDSIAASTHSIFLYDQSSGGAGYAPRLLDDVAGVLAAAEEILTCPNACLRGCSACVLVADLFAQQDTIDRRAALDFVAKLLTGLRSPQAEDIVAPGTVLSPPIADVINRRLAPGMVASLLLPDDLDLTALARPPFSTLFANAESKGAEVRLVLTPKHLAELDEATRAGLRNASHKHSFTLWSGSIRPGANGAVQIAVLTGPNSSVGFFSRDVGAAIVGPGWGVGEQHPVVQAPVALQTDLIRVPDDFFERENGPGARVTIVNSDPGRAVRLFGTGLVSRLLKPDLEAAGLWKPGQLVSLSYSDRYVKAPLPALLLMRVAAALRDALASKDKVIPLALKTRKLDEDRYGRAPNKIWSNWTNEHDREDTICALAKRFSFECDYDDNLAHHGRKLMIRYDDGSEALVLFDQGFGYWLATGNIPHNFRASPEQQAKALIESSAFVAGTGESYIAVTRA